MELRALRRPRASLTERINHLTDRRTFLLLFSVLALIPFAPDGSSLSLAIFPILGAIGAFAGGVGGLAGALGGRSSSTSTDLKPAGEDEVGLENLIYGGSKGYAGGETEAEFRQRRMQELMDETGFDGYMSDPGGMTQKFLKQVGDEWTKRTSSATTVGGPLADIQKMVNAGPGQADVERSLNSQRGLADMLRQLSQSGGLPTAEDTAASTSLAGGLFNARRTSMNQTFQDLDTDNARLAARLGRDPLDPILRAKLGTTKARMSDSLAAEQTDWANNFALNLPGRRLGFASDAASVDAQLAAQAAQNRATLLGLGTNLLNSERNFRLGAAGKTTTQNANLGDAIGGFFGGAGAGLKIGSAFNSFGGNSGGGSTYNLDSNDIKMGTDYQPASFDGLGRVYS
jgi:hypothetical protein